jgi:ATP-dependent RNA helicase DeaD
LTSKDAAPSLLEHHFLYCRHQEREAALANLIKTMHPKQGIIFCRSRIECEKLTRTLQRDFDGIDYLHAGLNQDVRSVVTNKFRNGKIRLLVATDVVSRGLDFSGVTHVFIFHLGDDPDIYVHRSGRTGRFDKAGSVVTLVTDRELATLKRVLEVIKKEPNWVGPPPPEGAGSRPAPRRRPPYRRTR